MDWLLQRTTTDATYLQVAILLAIAAFVILPLGYITVLDLYKIVQAFLKEDAHVSRDQ